MAQLNQFNGGLNKRVAPHIININEGVIYENIDNSKVSLAPIKSYKDENTIVEKYLINFKDTWVSSSTRRDYQEFQEKLYFSDSVGKPQKSNDGITWYNLGIDKPMQKPDTTISGTGQLNGMLQYCYTYYNINDGAESIPSEYSTELEVNAQKVDITLRASDDNQVTTIRLYRLGGNLPNMQLVTELPNIDTTYTDNIEDLDIDGHVLNSFNNEPAPIGLKYLTEHNAMFFGVKGDKLYYSDIAYVNNWSPYNFIDFDDTLTGIGATGNGLLVFTKYKTYIVTGTSPITLSKYLLSSNQGCVEHKTISFAKNTLLWLSTDGICTSNGGDILVASRDKLGKLYIDKPEDSVVYDDVYYLAYNDRILALDTRYGVILKDIKVEAEGLSIYNDVLYFVNNSKLFSMYQSTNFMRLHYKSPKLSEGQISNIKNYKTIYIKCLGELSIKIYIDDMLVMTKDVDSKTTEVLVPQQQRQGYYIQFELEGTGELLELQYIVEGRQNGR